MGSKYYNEYINIMRVIIASLSVLLFSLSGLLIQAENEKKAKQPPVFKEMIKINVSFSYLDNNDALFTSGNSYYKIKDLKCNDYNSKRFITSGKQETHSILIDSTSKVIDYNSVCAIIK